MAAGDVLLGLSGKFYSGAAGSTATTERDNVSEVELALTNRMAEWLRRGKSWVGKKPTASEASISFKVLAIEGDTFITAILAAFINKTAISLYPTDRPSGEGLDADYYIEQCNRSEPNEGAIEYSVTAVPTDEQRDPAWT